MAMLRASLSARGLSIGAFLRHSVCHFTLEHQVIGGIYAL
jgi:hypothetical protein